MVKKNPKIGSSQVAGGIKVQLPADSPLIGILKTDQYDIVNVFTNVVDKTYVESPPGSGDPDEDFDLGEGEDEEPIVGSLLAPNLEDIVFIGKSGKRYTSGQNISDLDIYYDKNNNRFLKVKFEIKNIAGETVKGVIMR
jgi:hypothetical protein